MPASPAGVLRFGTFEVDPRSGEVRKAGVRIRLQDKPLQVLLVLLEHPGELVTRDQLRERLWSADTFVDFDHSVGTAVAKLRSALGDSAKNPRFVETLGGRGYRFIAPVITGAPPKDDVASAESAEPPPALAEAPRPAANRASWVGAALTLILVVLVTAVLAFDAAGIRERVGWSSRAPIRSLAVLPLQNMSGNPAEDYFVDGMTEELITTLAQLPGIQVTSRTSAMHYKGSRQRLPDIGRELNADALIEGSVVRIGGRIRITAQLVDARTDQHLWAQSYERDFADVLALQNDVARSIASEIRVRFAGGTTSAVAAARPVVPAAEEAYLRGRYHLNDGDEPALRQSVDDFTQAIAADPSNARSYAGLAQAYVALTDFYERPTQTMPRARAAAEHAVTLDERVADAHTALGAVRFLYDWNWRGAEDEFTRALTLNPASADAHVWYGVFLGQMGRFDRAVAEMTRAIALDPFSVPVRINAGWVFYLARQSDRAITEWRRALELDPNLGVAHTSIWLAYTELGRSGHIPNVTDGDSSPLNLATLAGVYAESGERGQAEAVLARLQSLAEHRYICAYEIAAAHAALRQDEEVFRWLRKGVDDRSICMPDLKVDPRFDRLRADPRFVQLLHDIGFTS